MCSLKIKQLIDNDDFEIFKQVCSRIKSIHLLENGIFAKAVRHSNKLFFQYLYNKALSEKLTDEFILTFEYYYSNCLHESLSSKYDDNFKFIIERMKTYDCTKILLSKGIWESSVIHSCVFDINKLVHLIKFIKESSIDDSIIQKLLMMEDKSSITAYEKCSIFKFDTSLNYLLYLTDDLIIVPPLKIKYDNKQMIDVLKEKRGFAIFCDLNM